MTSPSLPVSVRWPLPGMSVASVTRISPPTSVQARDRKSTRLNSSHGYISYAVFCLKKKKDNPASTRHPSAGRASARLIYLLGLGLDHIYTGPPPHYILSPLLLPAHQLSRQLARLTR